jgi:RNA polymerase primary sigma factor
MTSSNGHHTPDIGAGDLKDLIEQGKRTKPLDPVEQGRLLEQAALGDRHSQDRLVEAHLELVIRLAANHSGQGLSPDDLVQEGSIGLMEAIRGFAAGGDARAFEALAAERINARLDAALSAEAASVREEDLLASAATDYERVELQLARELRRSPTEDEMAEKLEWTVDRLSYVATVVADARRRHDEELLAFIDPGAVEIEEEGD